MNGLVYMNKTTKGRYETIYMTTENWQPFVHFICQYGLTKLISERRKR